MIRYLIFAGLCALTAAASASSHQPWALGGGLGQSFPTGPSTFFNNEEEELHGSLWGRYFFTRSLGAELNYQRLNFAGQSGASDANVTGYTLNGVMRCNCRADSRWTPLLALGLGVGEISDYGVKKYSELYALLRAGMDYSLLSNLALGAHVQMNYLPESSSNAPSELHALSYLVSLTYNFGSKAETQASPAPEPAKAAEVLVQDADGDGIADAADKCAGTPSGAKVNAYGCQEKEKAQVRLNLTFAPGKAVVAEDQKSQIEEMAKFMKDYPQTKVLIEGHTDNTGSEAINKKLSKLRAEAVRQSLIKDFGIEASRVSAEGFGSSKPVADNSAAEGRLANRRVVATISEQ